jgi:hypothetical protein
MTDQELTIERWMREAMVDGGIDRYDDLHVDQIDLQWKGRERWLEAGGRALSMAVGLRNRIAPDLTVALAFSLQSGPERQGPDFKDVEALQERLDWSPPSLYLFRKGEEPWRRIVSATEPSPHDFHMQILEVAGLEYSTTGFACYFIEFRRSALDETRRSVPSIQRPTTERLGLNRRRGQAARCGGTLRAGGSVILHRVPSAVMAREVGGFHPRRGGTAPCGVKRVSVFFMK